MSMSPILRAQVPCFWSCDFISWLSKTSAKVGCAAGAPVVKALLIDLFLKRMFPIFGFLGIKSFWTFKLFLLGVSCYEHIRTPFYLYAQSYEPLCMYLLPNQGKCARVLLYLVEPLQTTTPIRMRVHHGADFAGAVTAGITNENA